MNQDEIRDFLLTFDAAEVRKDEENKLEIFEVNFDKLEKIWQEKTSFIYKNGSSGSLSRFSFGRRTSTAC